ncbi:MAG: FHA domain-containing protein [Eubacterium sp.]|nr:FHA domain-containing protein [Eubacterium sp.]
MEINNIRIEGTGNMMTMKYSLLPSDEIDDTALERIKTNSPEGIVPVQVMDISGVRTLFAQFSGGVTLKNYLKNVLDKRSVLELLKSLIACMDIGKFGIPVSYIAKKSDYIYVDTQTLKASCFVIPVKGDTNDPNEVRRFLRSVVSRMRFSDSDTDNYVARMLTILNSDRFSLNEMNVLVSEVQLEMEEAQLGDAPTGEAKVDKMGVLRNRASQSFPQQPPFGGQPQFQQPQFGQQPPFAAQPQFSPQPQFGQQPPFVPQPQFSQQPSFAAQPQFQQPQFDQQPQLAPQPVLNEPPVKRFDPMTGQPLNNPLPAEEPRPETPIEEVTPEAPVEETAPEVPAEESQPETPIEEVAQETPVEETAPEAPTEEPQPETPIEEAAPETAPEHPQGPTGMPGFDFQTGPSFDDPIGDDIPRFEVPSQEEISRYNDGLDSGTEEPAPVKRFDPMTGQPLENNNIPMGQPFNPFTVESPFIPQNPIYNPFGEPSPMDNPFAGELPVANPFAGQPPMDNPFVGQPPMDNQFIGNQSGPVPPAEMPSDGQPEQDPNLPRPHFVREKTGEKIFIDKDEFRIGKSKIHADYAIENNTAISRVHVVVTKRNGVSYLRDNESTNGTWIEGERLEPGREVLLKANMKVKFGDEDFTFYLREGV